MLPSQKRLSRADFVGFLAKKDQKTAFNKLGTVKYRKNPINQASVVISSKHEKRAVYRNKLRRRLYSLFEIYFRDSVDHKQYILYVSKQATLFDYKELKTFFYELFKKTTQ